MRVKIIKCRQPHFWYSNKIGKEYNVRQCKNIDEDYELIGNDFFANIEKEDCEIIEEKQDCEMYSVEPRTQIEEWNHTAKKINSEYHFTKEVNEFETVSLTLYLDYENKTYDFMQSGEEGLFPRNYNVDTKFNKTYFELGLEVLKFVQSELYE